MTSDNPHSVPPHRTIAEVLTALADPHLLASVLESAPECVQIIARDGTLTYANAEVARMLEADNPAQIVGRDYADFVAPGHRAGWRESHARVCAGERLTWEYEVVSLKGNRRTLHAHAVPLPLRGEGDGHLMIARPLRNGVTERNLARLQAVVGSMAEGLVIADGSGNLVQWNTAALKMHGYESEAELLSYHMRYLELYTLRYPDGELVPLERWPMHRVLRGEVFRDYEVYVRRNDINHERFISYSGGPVRDREGNVELGVLTLHDVTEARRAQEALRESEAQLKLALSIAEIGTFEHNLRADVVKVNDRGRTLFGWPPEQQLSFNLVRQHMHPEERDRVTRHIFHAMSPLGPGHFDLQHRIVRVDGAVRWIRVRGQVRFESIDGKREAVRSVGTYIDITEQKESEQRREALLDAERATRAEVERISKLKDEFLATLSHELRTPLNAILGWAQILRGGARDDRDLNEGLETIERNARAQTQLIEDLLDMSRIISGKVQLEVQRVDIAQVITNAVDTVRHSADAKGVQLLTLLDPDVKPVSGDPGRLQQVLWNLLTNAIKFTPSGGRVQVVLGRINGHLRISVNDTGEGIRPDFMPYVFDRFKQADASTTRRHGGLGLGLAIVKQLVELHGGVVHASSPGVGKGATFEIALPMTGAPPDPAAEPHPSQDASARRDPLASGCPMLDGVRVLVVDDAADSRTLVKRLLEDCHATVTTAASTAEAIESIEAHPPHVLVSDIAMPVEDGYQLIRRVRAMTAPAARDLPAVALSAYARAEDRGKAILAGYQVHVAKPVESLELIAVIASLAKRHPPFHEE